GLPCAVTERQPGRVVMFSVPGSWARTDAIKTLRHSRSGSTTGGGKMGRFSGSYCWFFRHRPENQDCLEPRPEGDPGSAPGGVWRRGQLPAKPGEPFAAEPDEPALDLDLEEVVERLVGEDPDHRAGGQPQLLPVPQPGRVVVLRLADDHRLAVAELAEPLQIAVPQFTCARWDRGAVRVFPRFAQMCGGGGFETRGGGGFDRLRLGIDLAAVEPEHASQEEFDQPVPADHPQRLRDPGLGQLRPGFGGVTDPAGVLESLEHPGD